MVGQCSACNEYQQSQCKEPLMSHEISERLWSHLAVDVFALDKEDYLMTADFYSDFWEVDTLPDMTAETVIERSKAHFSRYGVPDVMIKGRQFAGEEFAKFASQTAKQNQLSKLLRRSSRKRRQLPGYVEGNPGLAEYPHRE